MSRDTDDKFRAFMGAMFGPRPNAPAASAMTLADFLLARITEDEQAARSVWPERYTDRMLAECEAKRRIVEEHPRDEDGYCYDSHSHSRGCKWLWPCPTLRLLALPYADHDDYREAWKP